jgi:hypothetical protein
MTELPRRELGSYPPDFEPWFLRWNSVMFFPNPLVPKTPVYGWTGEAGTLPCHEHKTCKAKVLAKNPYPPRVCPGCGIDTLTEQEKVAEMEKTLGASDVFRPA